MQDKSLKYIFDQDPESQELFKALKNSKATIEIGSEVYSKAWRLHDIVNRNSGGAIEKKSRMVAIYNKFINAFEQY